MEEIHEYKILNKTNKKNNLFLYSIILNISYTIYIIKIYVLS